MTSDIEAGSKVYLDNPQLETDRLLLRKYTLSDASDLYRYYTDPDVIRYVTWDALQTLEDAKEFIEATIEMYDNDEAGEWGIVMKENNTLIGSCGFAWYDMQHSCAQIGFMLAKDYWGKGIATEALKKIIEFGLLKMNINRIEGFHITGNEVSGRVMEKAGMCFEGVLRQKIKINDVYHNLNMYAIIKSDL